MAIVKDPFSDNLAIVGSDRALQVKTNRPEKKHLGTYAWSSGLITPATAAQAAVTNSSLFIINRPGSAIMLSMRRAEVTSITTGLAANVLRYAIEKFSFVGNPSAAAIWPCKIDSNHATPQAHCTLLSTGMTSTISLGIAFSFKVVSGITAVERAVPVLSEWEPSGPFTLIRPGEGIAFRQLDAGVATDPRRVLFNAAWDEYELSAI